VLFHSLHDGHGKLDEVIADEGYLILHALDYRSDKLRVLEDLLTGLFRLLGLEVALEEDDLQKIQQMHLHRIVLVVNDLVKGAQDRLNDQMCDLVADLRVTLQALKDELHKLTSRCIHSLRFLVQSIIH
jgi:hypothetical protein